jgi:diphthamide biosynthesis protein 4
MTNTLATPLNLYAVLDIPESSSIIEIKQAYHRALLKFHPDKRHKSSGAPITERVQSASNGLSPVSFPISEAASLEQREIHVLKQAYDVLSNDTTRAAYDASLASGKKSGPRPAEVVSLQDFSEEVEVHPSPDGCHDLVRWRHPCRCGGAYVIDEDDMERGQHLVGCWSCSEIIWVGYEAVEED